MDIYIFLVLIGTIGTVGFGVVSAFSEKRRDGRLTSAGWATILGIVTSAMFAAGGTVWKYKADLDSSQRSALQHLRDSASIASMLDKQQVAVENGQSVLAGLRDAVGQLSKLDQKQEQLAHEADSTYRHVKELANPILPIQLQLCVELSFDSVWNKEAVAVALKRAGEMITRYRNVDDRVVTVRKSEIGFEIQSWRGSLSVNPVLDSVFRSFWDSSDIYVRAHFFASPAGTDSDSRREPDLGLRFDEVTASNMTVDYSRKTLQLTISLRGRLDAQTEAIRTTTDLLKSELLLLVGRTSSCTMQRASISFGRDLANHRHLICRERRFLGTIPIFLMAMAGEF